MEWRRKGMGLWVAVVGWFSIRIMIHADIANSAAIKELMQIPSPFELGCEVFGHALGFTIGVEAEVSGLPFGDDLFFVLA